VNRSTPAAAFKRIVKARVQVFLYLEDRELELGSMSGDTMMFLRSQFAAEERRKASQRVRDTQNSGTLSGSWATSRTPLRKAAPRR
jgi:hypothetical protein